MTSYTVEEQKAQAQYIANIQPFTSKLKRALEEGILLTVKFGLLILIFTFAYKYVVNTQNQANNGHQAALAILEYQSKGVLPKLPIAEKKNEEVSSNLTAK